jgi:hypothetical protein
MHRHNSLRGLHRERRHRRHAITIVRRKSFQVGRRARAAGRIKSCDRQQDGWCVARLTVVSTQLRVSSGETAADNYAGAAIFRIGAPATKNVRGFLCIAQQQYLKIARHVRRRKNPAKMNEGKTSEILTAPQHHGKSPRTSVASATRPTAST